MFPLCPTVTLWLFSAHNCALKTLQLHAVPAQQHHPGSPLTSLFGRFLFLRGFGWVIVITAVRESHCIIAPVLRQGFTQSLVFFLLNKNENYVNRSRNLLRNILYISKVVAISKAYNTLFPTSFWGKKCFLKFHTSHLSICTFASTCLPQTADYTSFVENFFLLRNLGIKNCIKDCYGKDKNINFNLYDTVKEEQLKSLVFVFSNPSLPSKAGKILCGSIYKLSWGPLRTQRLLFFQSTGYCQDNIRKSEYKKMNGSKLLNT